MNKLALIIEDHPFFSDALSLFLKDQLDCSNVRIAHSIEDVLANCAELDQISLILMDLGLPGLRGVDAVQLLKKKFLSAAIVIISASDDRREIDAVLRAGAKAFISKSIPNVEVKKALQEILSGKELDTQNISCVPGNTDMSPLRSCLTERQAEVLKLLCLGMSNKEICLRLKVAEVTVKIHISAIFRALGVLNRTQAVLAARRFGYDKIEA